MFWLLLHVLKKNSFNNLDMKGFLENKVLFSSTWSHFILDITHVWLFSYLRSTVFVFTYFFSILWDVLFHFIVNRSFCSTSPANIGKFLKFTPLLPLSVEFSRASVTLKTSPHLFYYNILLDKTIHIYDTWSIHFNALNFGTISFFTDYWKGEFNTSILVKFCNLTRGKSAFEWSDSLNIYRKLCTCQITTNSL